MRSDTVRQIVNIAAVIATIAMNSASQALRLNGYTVGDIANSFSNNFFLPANYVFSIWGVIYIGLISFAVYQALPAQRENPLLRRIGYWFALSCAANIVWLLLFHYLQFWLSTVAMLVLLGALLVIYVRINTNPARVSTAQRWCVNIPFSIYLGWITVATVANFTYALLGQGWDGFGIAYETWGAIMIVVGALIAGFVAFRFKDIAYAAVIVWAFVGIIARHPAVGTVAIPAGVMAAAVALVALVGSQMNSGRSRMTPGAA